MTRTLVCIAQVRTVNPAYPMAEASGIRAGWIVALAGTAAMHVPVGPETNVIDAPSRPRRTLLSRETPDHRHACLGETGQTAPSCWYGVVMGKPMPDFPAHLFLRGRDNSTCDPYADATKNAGPAHHFTGRDIQSGPHSI